MNILDFNRCESPGCNCGWNISFGGTDPSEFERLREIVKGLIESDDTDYSRKITMTEMFSGEKIVNKAN